MKIKAIMCIIFLGLIASGCQQSALGNDVTDVPVGNDMANDSVIEIGIHPYYEEQYEIVPLFDNSFINHTAIVSMNGVGEQGKIADELIRSHVSVFCPGFFDLDDPKSSAYSKSILDALGIGIVQWVSIGNPHETRNPAYVIQYDDATCKDIDGNLIIFHSGAGDAMCTNSPYWRETVIEESKQAVEMGAIAVAADEWPGTTSITSYGGCFCEHCMEGFRQYLIDNQDVPKVAEALNEANVTNLDEFNYKDYINENCRDAYDAFINKQADLQQGNEVPLFSIFQEFQLASAKELMSEINCEIKEINEDVFFTANMANLRKQFIEVADIADFYSPEIIITYPISAQSAVEYEIGKAYGGIVNASPNSHTVTPLMLSDSAADAMKIYTAEAYSRGGLLVNCYGNFSFTGEYNNIPHEWNLNMDELYSYYDYIHYNEMLFENLYDMADVGVLYDVSYRNSFDQCMRELIESGISCKAIAIGDNNILKKPLQIEDLEGINLLVLPGNYEMETETIEVINEYIEMNGKVLSFNQVAKCRHDGAIQENDILNKNHVHINEYIPFIPRLNTVEPYEIPEEMSLVVNKVNELIPKQIEISDIEVIGSYYYSPVYNGELIHLVNYGFDYDNSANLVKNNVDVKVYNSTPYDDEDIKVYIKSPENSVLTEIEASVQNGFICFRIPEITVWSTVIIGQGERIEAIEKINNAKIEYENMEVNDERIVNLLEAAFEYALNDEYANAYEMLEEACALLD